MCSIWLNYKFRHYRERIIGLRLGPLCLRSWRKLFSDGNEMEMDSVKEWV